ncbi:hypothetical protein GCM10010182_00820 [Actinomadura cremea]|nr:hypothetical protein GCM10010182_00820 [Actinomadura cremea]
MLAKQWLESTTHLEMPFNVYEHEKMTTLVRLDGARKRYDLMGYWLERKTPLYVEVKNYTVVGNQPTEYSEHLANAYSATARNIVQQMDAGGEFMWVTWHPFSQSKWKKLTNHEEIRKALKEYPEALAGNSIDEDILRTVSKRLWLQVLSPRQHELLLTRQELYKVQEVLDRKGRK